MVSTAPPASEVSGRDEAVVSFSLTRRLRPARRGPGHGAVDIPEGSIVLGADTIVVLDNEVLGKPQDEADARQMLERLSGRSHSVVTGVALLIKGDEVVFHNETKVYFKELAPFEIESYIASGEPMDKAGAYGIQGKGAL